MQKFLLLLALASTAAQAHFTWFFEAVPATLREKMDLVPTCGQTLEELDTQIVQFRVRKTARREFSDLLYNRYIVPLAALYRIDPKSRSQEDEVKQLEREFRLLIAPVAQAILSRRFPAFRADAARNARVIDEALRIQLEVLRNGRYDVARKTRPITYLYTVLVNAMRYDLRTPPDPKSVTLVQSPAGPDKAGDEVLAIDWLAVDGKVTADVDVALNDVIAILIHRMRHELTDVEKDCLRLHIVEDLSVSDVARARGTERQATRKSVQRAFWKLNQAAHATRREGSLFVPSFAVDADILQAIYARMPEEFEAALAK